MVAFTLIAALHHKDLDKFLGTNLACLTFLGGVYRSLLNHACALRYIRIYFYKSLGMNILKSLKEIKIAEKVTGFANSADKLCGK